MQFFLAIVAVFEFLMGTLAFSTAKSAVHEILGTLLMGFAFLTAGAAGIIQQIKLSTEEAVRAMGGNLPKPASGGWLHTTYEPPEPKSTP